jgi:hypothetical protein
MQVPTHVCIVGGVPRGLPSGCGLPGTIAGTNRCQTLLKCLKMLQTDKAEAPVPGSIVG